MAEDTTTTTTTDDTGGDPGAGQGGGDKTFTQEELDRKIGERLARERSKFADYDDLKAKAAEFDKLRESQKSEQQKLADELEAARRDGSMSKGELLKLQVALDKAPEGMTPKRIRKLAGRLTGSTREELEADADELFAEFEAEAAGGRKADLKQGQRGKSTSEDPDAWLRRMAGRR